MSKKTSKRAGFAEWQKSLQRQFRNLDPKDPSLWPLVPRLGLYALISFMPQGSSPQAWSISSSASTPNSLYKIS